MSAMGDVVVRGGVAGIGARTAELRLVAGRLSDVALDLATSAVGVVAALTDPDVLAAVVVLPGTGAPVLLTGTELTARLTACSAELAVLASALQLAADAYDSVDGATATVLSSVAAAVLRATVLGPGPGAGLPVGSLGLVTALGGVAALAATDPDAAGRWVAARPRLVDAAVRVAPGMLGLRDARDLARLVSVVAPAVGLAEPTGVRLRPPVQGPVPNVRAAAGLGELLLRNRAVSATRATGTDPPEAGHIRVDEVRLPDGRVSWVVHVPGTQEWDVDGQGPPTDMTANIRSVAGLPTAAELAVVAAMRGAGVRPGQPVLLVGHSQGGLTALGIASRPRWQADFSVTHVVTAGAPVAGARPPRSVKVLSIEHTDDLVPVLDGGANPDQPSWTTVRAPAPRDGVWSTDAVPAHSSAAYAVTAAGLDSSGHPSVAGFREGLDVFLDAPGVTVVSRDAVARHAPDVAEGHAVGGARRATVPGW